MTEVVFGNLAVVASFMFFCLSQRYDVSYSWTLRVHHHNHFTGQQAKTDLARFAVILLLVFTSNREVVPYCIASDKVQPVAFDVQPALGFIPSQHNK